MKKEQYGGLLKTLFGGESCYDPSVTIIALCTECITIIVNLEKCFPVKRIIKVITSGYRNSKGFIEKEATWYYF